MFRHRVTLWICLATLLSLLLLGGLHHQGHITIPVKPMKEFIGWEEIEIPLDEPETAAIPQFTDSTVRIYIGVVILRKGIG